MEAGRYAAPIHGYGMAVQVSWSAVSWVLARSDWFWRLSWGTASFGAVRFGEAR